MTDIRHQNFGEVNVRNRHSRYKNDIDGRCLPLSAFFAPGESLGRFSFAAVDSPRILCMCVRDQCDFNRIRYHFDKSIRFQLFMRARNQVRCRLANWRVEIVARSRASSNVMVPSI